MPSVSRDSLKKFLEKSNNSKARRLAQLRLEHSDIATLRNTFIKSLNNTNRIAPTILPTQASGRWSYINPPLSNFPKKCINPQCPKYHHEKTAQCWSIRDCLVPDTNTFWIEHDLDAVEHRIYCLILSWQERINELITGKDPHTKVTCELFNLPYPTNPYNPHTSIEDTQWRGLVHWQGKDDTRRTMSKNFTYGGQYFYVSICRPDYKPKKPNMVYKRLVYNPMFVYSIPNIQSYLIEDSEGNLVPPDYLNLAIRFVESNIEIQKRKAEWMERIRKDKIARTLYGAPRKFYFSNQSTAKEGFNHVIQGTVASYINESCILLQKEFPESYLVHNQHDSLKWAFTYQSQQGRAEEENQILAEVKKLTQRELFYNNSSIPITATYKIVRAEDE